MEIDSVFFSVVIPAFNAEQTIAKTIESVKKQTFLNFEIIVIDDESTDKTKEVVENFVGVKYFFQFNQGPGVARNSGANLAKGNYLIFLDADDILFPWALQIYFESINKYNFPEYFAGEIYLFNDDEDLLSVKQEPTREVYYTNFLEAGISGVFAGSCMIGVRRKIFINSGGFTTARINAEDHDFSLKLGACNGFFKIGYPYTVAYRQHHKSLTQNLSKTTDGLKYIYSKLKTNEYQYSNDNKAKAYIFWCLRANSHALSLLNQHFLESFWFYRRAFFNNIKQNKFKFIFGYWWYAIRYI